MSALFVQPRTTPAAPAHWPELASRPLSMTQTSRWRTPADRSGWPTSETALLWAALRRVASGVFDMPVEACRLGGRLRAPGPVQSVVDLGAHDRAFGCRVVEPAPQRAGQQPAGVL